jgi:hypothetical protein
MCRCRDRDVVPGNFLTWHAGCKMPVSGFGLRKVFLKLPAVSAGTKNKSAGGKF